MTDPTRMPAGAARRRTAWARYRAARHAQGWRSIRLELGIIAGALLLLAAVAVAVAAGWLP